MSRKDELLKLFDDKECKTVVSPMIDDLIFIEEQLTELKKYPFIKIHPLRSDMQKITPAGKLYKDLLAQEKDIVRILCSQLNKDGDNEKESPLRTYLKSLEVR